jgi:hypothetical protein
VIAIHIFERDGFRVRQVPWLLINQVIQHINHGTVGNRQNLRAIVGIAVDVASVSVHQSSSAIQLHPVDRRPLREVDRSIAREAACPMRRGATAAAVDGYPAFAFERWSDVGKLIGNFKRGYGGGHADRGHGLTSGAGRAKQFHAVQQFSGGFCLWIEVEIDQQQSRVVELDGCIVRGRAACRSQMRE